MTRIVVLRKAVLTCVFDQDIYITEMEVMGSRPSVAFYRRVRYHGDNEISDS